MITNHQAVYDLVTISSIGVRLTPVDRQAVHTSHMFEMQATSAESNVLNIGSSLGLNTLVMTKFVKNSSIAAFIKNELRKRNINFIGKEMEQEGAWGYRHQFNIADSGFGVRGPRVQNDRAGEVGKTINQEDYDLNKIFVLDGCKILHLSGLICALSHNTSQCCMRVAQFAKEQGTLISFDLNYRKSFWLNRESELRKIFSEIASLADILIGNEEDFQLALGIEGPDAGGTDIQEKIEDYRKMIDKAQAIFPNVKVFATTLREVKNANIHHWGAIMLHHEHRHVIEPREIQVLDRIGGGDGFVGGLLYAIIRNLAPEKWLQFGWASGALVTTLLTDYGAPYDESQIWSIFEGNARVIR